MLWESSENQFSRPKKRSIKKVNIASFQNSNFVLKLIFCSGMRPLMYSEITAIGKSIGWHRIGHHVTYSPKTEVKCAKYCKTGVPLSSSAELEFQFAVLSWQVEFTHKGDMCYFAHCYPYTFTRLRNFIGQQKL